MSFFCEICGEPTRLLKLLSGVDGKRVFYAGVADPLYRGPEGHAPQNICLECWAQIWDEIEEGNKAEAQGAYRHEGRRRAYLVLWGLSRGLDRPAVAELADMSGRSLRRFVAHLRMHPAETRKLLATFGFSHVRRG